MRLAPWVVTSEPLALLTRTVAAKDGKSMPRMLLE